MGMALTRNTWIHRIDRIPVLRRNVEIQLPDGSMREAITLPSTLREQREWCGIGCEVVYCVGGYRFLGRDVLYWRYR